MTGIGVFVGDAFDAAADFEEVVGFALPGRQPLRELFLSEDLRSAESN